MNRNHYRDRNHQDAIDLVCQKIDNAPKLDAILTVQNISLPNGFAYKVAYEMKDINPTQLRKFFDTAKSAEQKSSFEQARNTLFTLVPQMAYSVGRDLCDRKLYSLIQSCIKPEKIKDENDVKAFVSFFEAILAYSKLKETERKRRR